MKKLLLLLAILPFIVSCQKSDFDLNKIQFPINVDSLKTKYKIKEDKAFSDMVRYYTTDDGLLFFDGYSFSGSLDGNNKMFENKLSFYKENQSDRVDAYEIQIKTTDEAEKFEDILTTQLGKTDFYYKNNDFSYRIWSLKNKTYFFETNNTGNYNGKHFKSCHLYVIDSNNVFFTNFLCSGGFQYYGDYLYEKNKPENKGKKFTYLDFVNIQEKEDGKDSYFLKDYVK